MTSIPPTDPTAGVPSAQIRDDGGLADIDLAVPKVLDELVVERRVFRADDCGGRAAFPSGLVPRVAAAARRAGYPAEVKDVAEPPVPAAMATADGLDAAGRRLAAALAASRRGVVLARSNRERMAVIRQAIDLFSTARIMVVTKTRGEARRIGEALRSGRGEPVDVYTRQPTTSDARIQVGTAGSLDLSIAGVVLLVDATQTLHDGVGECLLLLRRARVYGLLDDRRRLVRRERLVIEGNLGPVIGRLGAADDATVEVRAAFAAWTGGERPDRPMGLDWKPGSIWANDRRNVAIARLAAALASGNLAACWEHGLFLDGEPELPPVDGRRVAVLVESPLARRHPRTAPSWLARALRRRRCCRPR
jgi:hypothetical protein